MEEPSPLSVCLFRFINFVTNKNFNTKVTPKIIQRVRIDFLKNNAEMVCLDGSFIPEDKIRSNYEKLIKIIEGVDVTTEQVETLSKTIIRNAGQMFFSLNSCPSLHERLYFKIIFGSQTQSMISKSALNIARYSKKDIQPETFRIFLKIASVMRFEYIQHENESFTCNENESFANHPLYNLNISRVQHKELLKTVSNHPVHILTKNGEMSPSSFIPFCSFGEDPLGTNTSDFDVPVCNIFKQRVRNEQLCYETDLEKMRSKDIDTAKKQLKIGLVLILDYNEELQLGQFIKDNKSKSGEKKLFFDHINEKSALISFDTISNFFLN